MFVKCFYVGLYTGRQDATTHYHTGRCVRMVLQRRQDTAYTGPSCVRQDIYRQDTPHRQDTRPVRRQDTLVSVRSTNVWTATSHTGLPHINSDRTPPIIKGCPVDILIRLNNIFTIFNFKLYIIKLFINI